jgi:tRNA-splicing ligase RtcB
MRVPCVVFGDTALFQAMDDMVAEQSRRVASLPGIVRAAYAMPDAHWGYGFPIGGVAAFDEQAGGVVSAGGVGFDIACGVRCLTTGLSEASIMDRQAALADALFAGIPAGVGSTGAIRLSDTATDAMLVGGARWAIEQGYGKTEDLARTEELGCMKGADPAAVSAQARRRQRDEMGTLGSGNHYLEVQVIREITDQHAAQAYGLRDGEVVVMIHCGSRGLGHQIGSEYLLRMASEAAQHGLSLPDRELACAPIQSALGQSYLGAMRSAINCALANRQILTHLVREIFAKHFPHVHMPLLYDVSHNTCKVEEHQVDGRPRALHVHRKGATRAWGPGHPELDPSLRDVGQPVLIGGSMGTGSYILAGSDSTGSIAFASACHGAGRAMSRHAAQRTWRGRALQDELAARGIIVRSPSLRGIAEEAPGAYKDVTAVVNATARAGLARVVARLSPLICIKG